MENQNPKSEKLNIVCKNVFKGTEDQSIKENYNRIWVELIHQFEKEKASHHEQLFTINKPASRDQ